MRRFILASLGLSLACTACTPLPIPTPTPTSEKTGDHGWVGEIEWNSGSIPPPHCWSKTATVTRETVTIVEKSCDPKVKAVTRTVKTADVTDTLSEFYHLTEDGFSNSGRVGGQWVSVRLGAPSGKGVKGTSVEPDELDKLRPLFEKLG